VSVFSYRKIGTSFFDELQEKLVERRDSIVLVAPRYGGKRYLMHEIHRRLLEQEDFQVLPLDAATQPNVGSEEELRDWLATVVCKVEGHFDERTVSNDWFAPLDWLIANSARRVVLLVFNVDRLTNTLARKLLKKVRTLVEARTLVAALSGEDVFLKLVYGPGSEFNCVHQYFLQGFDKALFADETRLYADSLRMCFADEEEAISLLYSLSGGYLSIMKTLLRETAKDRWQARRSLAESVQTSEIPRTILPDLLRQPPRIINNAPECWDTLLQLLDRNITSVSSFAEGLTPLEVAGVVRRDGWQLRIASPLLGEFLRAYYNDKRLGDLYARNDQWDKAFAYYERLTEEERVRPANIDDFREAAFSIKTLAADLHLMMSEGIEKIGWLFEKTCCLVLGFREVAYLEWNGCWKLVPNPSLHLSEAVATEVMRQLSEIKPADLKSKVGMFSLIGAQRHYTLVAILPTMRTHQFRAVVVSDYAANRILTPERSKLAGDLLGHFVRAYQQATDIEVAREHLAMRDQYIKVANSIFDGLGSKTRDVEHVVRSAAEALRNLGYRRVSFCLVDPAKERIKGMLDVSDDLNVSVADMTDWPLSDPKADIQPYVVKTKKPYPVPDAQNDPLVNSKVLKAARLTAFAVVPLLDQLDEVNGTLHVEREDGNVPGEEELDSLMQFCKQLAIAIRQSEQVNLLQSALDQLASSIFISDSTMRLRYANKQAAELLQVADGWLDAATAKPITSTNLSEGNTLLLEEALKGKRNERHVDTTLQGSSRAWEVLSDNIKSRSKGEPVVGAFMRIRDFTYIYKMFDAFKLIAKATDRESAYRQLMAAAQQLGFAEGRLYLISTESPDCLVSYDYFGSMPEEAAITFREGGTPLKRQDDPNNESWACLDRGRPMVFYFDKTSPDGSVYINPRGQEARVVNKPRLERELNKKPGDSWVDFPLVTLDGLKLGKLTLKWDEDRWPREFSLLEVLAGLVSNVLQAFLRQEQATENLMKVREQAAQKVMATVAHNIGTQMASLDPLLSRYKLREKSLPELEVLNCRFWGMLKEINTIIERAKERLAVDSPQIARLDLAQCLGNALGTSLPPENYQVSFECVPFEIAVDGHLLKIALAELIQNSKDAVQDETDLFIEMTLAFKPHHQGQVAHIIYRDNGPGVPFELKEKIFEDFFSRHPVSKKKGTGLGMGWVRRVIEAHGGSITEQGMPGQGG